MLRYIAMRRGKKPEKDFDLNYDPCDANEGEFHGQGSPTAALSISTLKLAMPCRA